MADHIGVRLHVLPHGEGLPLPSWQTAGSAGADLYAAVESVKAHAAAGLRCVEIEPGAWKAIPTGLCFALPEGWEGQVRPRSGLAVRHGVTVLNSPGTLDSDYRGELLVVLVNHGSTPFVVFRGDRIAQLVLSPVTRAAWIIETSPTDAWDTNRGTGGFGSTGR